VAGNPTRPRFRARGILSSVRISPIKPGDVVKVDEDGTIYYAEVVERGCGELAVQPTVGAWRAVSAEAIVGHWRKSKATP
jgi:hypothetical protein